VDHGQRAKSEERNKEETDENYEGKESSEG
jgi:hypothetical protein